MVLNNIHTKNFFFFKHHEINMFKKIKETRHPHVEQIS